MSKTGKAKTRAAKRGRKTDRGNQGTRGDGTPAKAGGRGKPYACINRLQDAVTALLDEGTDPVVIMESLTAISRNLALPVPHVHRLTAVILAASVLPLDELRRLDKWLCARIADEKAKAGEIFPSPGRIVVEERKGKDITYRLEFVKCGKDSCRKCRRGPAHGPYWYAFGQGVGRGGQKYLGKNLDPQALAASVRVD